MLIFVLKTIDMENKKDITLLKGELSIPLEHKRGIFSYGQSSCVDNKQSREISKFN